MGFLRCCARRGTPIGETHAHKKTREMLQFICAEKGDGVG